MKKQLLFYIAEEIVRYFIEFTHAATVERFENFNQAIDKWHSIVIKIPVS